MSSTSELKRPFSGPPKTTTHSFRVMSINIEGLTPVKEVILAKIIKDNSMDVLAMQETHCGAKGSGPKIAGMKVVAERPHEKNGSALSLRRRSGALH